MPRSGPTPAWLRWQEVYLLKCTFLGLFNKLIMDCILHLRNCIWIRTCRPKILFAFHLNTEIKSNRKEEKRKKRNNTETLHLYSHICIYTHCLFLFSFFFFLLLRKKERKRERERERERENVSNMITIHIHTIIQNIFIVYLLWIVKFVRLTVTVYE